MFPVLYTDATDAWKLRSRRNRLSIVTAGVRTELYIALLATFFWNVLPDGPLKSAAFFLATTSWLGSSPRRGVMLISSTRGSKVSIASQASRTMCGVARSIG